MSSLTFTRHEHLSAAVLAPEAWFEDNLLRDSEPHEFALFGPAEDKFDPAEADSGLDKWTATKRKGPKRAQGPDMPSPLKEKRGTSAVSDDPFRCLRAASKLLQVYPLPRTIEHVSLLQNQHQGLIDSIAQYEHQLRQPVPRAQAPAAVDDDALRLAELEAALKSEELELFAIKQMYADKQASSASARGPAPAGAAAPSAAASGPARAAPAAGPSNMRSAILEKKRAMMAQQQRPSVAASPLRKRPAAGSTGAAAATPRSGIQPPRLSFGTTNKAQSPKTHPSTPPTTNTPNAKAATPGSAQTTPRAAAAPPSAKTKRPQGVRQEDLEMVTGRVWVGVGDAIRPWARKTLVKQGKQVPSPLSNLTFDDTFATLATILSTATAASAEPSSPGSVASSFATLATATDGDNPDAEPPAPAPAALVEYQLLNLLLATISGEQATPSLVPLPDGEPSLPALGITLRDPVLPSSLPGSPKAELGRKDPMVSMTGLKVHLGRFAKARGWQEELATTAIYGLVSKTVLRIDRRGREGPMLGFRN